MAFSINKNLTDASLPPPQNPRQRGTPSLSQKYLIYSLFQLFEVKKQLRPDSQHSCLLHRPCPLLRGKPQVTALLSGLGGISGSLLLSGEQTKGMTCIWYHIFIEHICRLNIFYYHHAVQQAYAIATTENSKLVFIYLFI